MCERERERNASACMRRHQAFALAPVRERRVSVYEEAPGFRPGPRERDASGCTRRHQAFVLAPVGVIGGYCEQALDRR